MISVFGSSGFIGSNWMDMYGDQSYPEERSCIDPKYKECLYFRGTNTNYNVFTDRHVDIDTNLTLTIKTLENLTKDSCFNLISSWFVCFPRGFYSATKLCQEHLVQSYCNTFGIPFRTLRLCNVIGLDSGASNKKNFLVNMIKKVKRGEEVNLYEGENYRNFLDVETCCRGIKHAIDHGEIGEDYNIGASTSYRIGDLMEYCIQKTKSKSKIKIIEVPEFHKQVQVGNFWMNTDKLKKIGFDNHINIYEKLDEIIDKLQV